MTMDRGTEFLDASGLMQQLKGRVLRMDTLEADHVYVASTPVEGVYQLTFHGSQEANLRHEAWEGTRYRMVTNLVRLGPSTRRLEASAVIAIDGWVHFDVGQGRWMHMKTEDTRVLEDHDNRQVSVEFQLELRGHKIGVLSYSYMAVLLVELR